MERPAPARRRTLRRGERRLRPWLPRGGARLRGETRPCLATPGTWRPPDWQLSLIRLSGHLRKWDHAVPEGSPHAEGNEVPGDGPRPKSSRTSGLPGTGLEQLDHV